MTTHRRYGLELRGDRWCSKRDLERLRKNAELDGSDAIAVFLREQQRCGVPIWDEQAMVNKYIYKRAREHFKVDSLPKHRGRIPIGPEVNLAPYGVVIRPIGGIRHKKLVPQDEILQYEIITGWRWRARKHGGWQWVMTPIEGAPRRYEVKDYDETESIVRAKRLTLLVDPTFSQLRTWLTKRLKFYGSKTP